MCKDPELLFIGLRFSDFKLQLTRNDEGCVCAGMATEVVVFRFFHSYVSKIKRSYLKLSHTE